MSEEIEVIENIELPLKQDTTKVEQPNRESIGLYVDYRTLNTYQFLIEAQTGTGGFSGDVRCKSYIIPNLSENFYQTRIKRAIYTNDYAKYIKAKYKDVFASQEVSTAVKGTTGETISDHPYVEFAHNITGGNINKNNLVKSVLNASWRDATAFIITDMGTDDTQPYVYLKTAIEVSTDENGKCLIETDDKGRMISITFNEAPLQDKKGTIYYRRYWGLDVFRLEASRDKENWGIVEEIDNTLTYKGEPFLPVEAFISQERVDNNNYLPFPESYAIASMNLGIYDRESVLDYLVDKQGHSTLALNGTMTSVPNGRDNALIVAEGDNKLFEPFYLSPDSKLPDVHSNRISSLKKQMYDMMDDGGVSVQAAGLAPESGKAKMFTFSAKASTSRESVRLAMEIDRYLEKSYKVYMNDDMSDWVSVTNYPEDFVPKPDLSLSEYEQASDYFSTRGLVLNEADVTKKILMKVNPNANSKELETLLTEIDIAARGTEA